MAKKQRISGGERNEKSGTIWTRDELKEVLDLYMGLGGKGICESNPRIQQLGMRLGRTTRSVEAQLIMFRSLERGGNYSRGSMSHFCCELWKSWRLIQVSAVPAGNSDGHTGPAATTIDAGSAVMEERTVSENGNDSTHGWNPTIPALLERTYGGRDAAVTPGAFSAGLLPDSEPPAGVADIMDRLHDRLSHDKSADPPDWVFLVGGPGNGKSYQLHLLLQRLGITIGEVKKSSRYLPDARLNGQVLKIVNDATIRLSNGRPGCGPGDLAKDCRKAAEGEAGNPFHLLVNVNRGILIEELAQIRQQPDWQAERALITWLMSPAQSAGSSWLIPVKARVAYYSTAMFRLDGANSTARVHAVFLDLLSLLEASPGSMGRAIQGLSTLDPKPAAYEVMQFTGTGRDNTPIGRLLMKVVDPSGFTGGPCKTCPAASLCPFLANARTLASPGGRQGLLRLLRGAEIASGRLFTFRDAWSLICTAIVGRRSEFDGTPCEWVRQKAKLASKPGSAGNRATIDLEMQRCHQTLFVSRVPTYFCGSRGSLFAQPPAVPALNSSTE